MTAKNGNRPEALEAAAQLAFDASDAEDALADCSPADRLRFLPRLRQLAADVARLAEEVEAAALEHQRQHPKATLGVAKQWTVKGRQQHYGNGDD